MLERVGSRGVTSEGIGLAGWPPQAAIIINKRRWNAFFIKFICETYTVAFFDKMTECIPSLSNFHHFYLGGDTILPLKPPSVGPGMHRLLRRSKRSESDLARTRA